MAYDDRFKNGVRLIRSQRLICDGMILARIPGCGFWLFDPSQERGEGWLRGYRSDGGFAQIDKLEFLSETLGGAYRWPDSRALLIMVNARRVLKRSLVLSDALYTSLNIPEELFEVIDGPEAEFSDEEIGQVMMVCMEQGLEFMIGKRVLWPGDPAIGGGV